MWTLSRIDFTGFPLYMCGHTYLLLQNEAEHFLAHLQVEVPTRISSNNKLPAYKYWPFLFFTNKLDAKVSCTREITKIQNIIGNMKSTCTFKCQTWLVADDTATTLAKTLSNQEKLGSFCFYGKNIGDYIGGGLNCMDWASSMLEQAKITKPGTKTTLEALQEMLSSTNEEKHTVSLHKAELKA